MTLPLTGGEKITLDLSGCSGLGDSTADTGQKTCMLETANVIISFCSTIAQNNLHAMRYTLTLLISTVDLTVMLATSYPDINFWYAYPYSCYSDGSFYKPPPPKAIQFPPSFSYGLWRYSWKGDVSGIRTDVDLNIRLLGKTTIGAPEVNVTNATITSGIGQTVDLLEGVTAKTSQYDVVTGGITYEITDESGQTFDLEKARIRSANIP